MNRLLFYIQQSAREIWFRCLIYCVVAVIALISGVYLGSWVPEPWDDSISRDGLYDILKILATSMLAVTTFSLSVLVQAFNTAANTATPRANKLIIENSTAQNVLGTFIGAFLFSMICIIGINSSLYSKGTVFLLFLFTAVIVAVVIIMLLRWIDQLSKLGRVSITIDMVEKSLAQAIKKRCSVPFLGGKKLNNTSILSDKHPIFCQQVGYVQYIDAAALDQIANDLNRDLYITVNPGSFMDASKPLLYMDKKESDDLQAISHSINNGFAIGDERTFQQDPRYGFVVLTEIALRALSPGINDPGTAIDVLGTYVRSCKLWNDSRKENPQDDIQYQRLVVAPIHETDILEDMLGDLLTVTAPHYSVSIRLKKALIALTQLENSCFAEHIDYWITQQEQLCQKALTKDQFHLLKQIN